MPDSFRIRSSKLDWLGDDEIRTHCLSAAVEIELNGCVLEIPNDELFTISTAALLLLRSLHEDVSISIDDHLEWNQMIPHCGYVMVESQQEVNFYGTCPVGISWSVEHIDRNVRLFDFLSSFGTDMEVTQHDDLVYIPWVDYASEILRIANEVQAFYQNASPKRFDDQETKQAYEQYWREYESLMKATERRRTEISDQSW